MATELETQVNILQAEVRELHKVARWFFDRVPKGAWDYPPEVKQWIACGERAQSPGHQVQKPAEDGRDTYTREHLQKIARMIDEELPQGWGFSLFAFPLDGRPGRLNYVANGH